MSKYSFRYGGVEVEIEGEDTFIKNSLPELLERTVQIMGAHAQAMPILAPAASSGKPQDVGASAPATKREGTINTVISRVGAKSCREVMVAAALHLSLYEGRERFSREEWETRAKEANVWKTDYATQKANAIKRLVQSGFVIENSAGVFSVSPSAVAQAEAKIAA